MSRHDNQAHLGFTVIELLIVIAIVSLLFQIMLPAIETSREAARRTQCANNLRQVGLATAGYESAHKLLPPAFRSRPHAHNFVAYLLPYFEERSIDEVYDFDKDWDADENKPAAEHDISVLRCPSSSRKQHWTSDYAIYRYVEQTLYHKLVHEKLIFRRKSTRGALQSKEIKMARITDGISKTVFVCEQSGLPDIYRLRERLRDVHGKGSRWADPNSRFDISHRCNGSTFDEGSQLVNCTNNGEIYSFHPGGANFVFGDSSVTYLLDDIDPNVLLSYLTARAGD